MAVWLGGVLTLVAWPDGRLAALTRFAPVATACVLVLGVTGMVATWEHAGGVPTLDSRYGLLLLLKLVFVGVTLGWRACSGDAWRIRAAWTPCCHWKWRC